MSEDGSHVISGFAGMILQHFLSKDPQSICVTAGSFEHGCSMRFYADHTQVHASNPPAEKKQGDFSSSLNYAGIKEFSHSQLYLDIFSIRMSDWYVGAAKPFVCEDA